MSQTQTHDSKQIHEFKDGVQKMGERAGEVKANLSGMAQDATSTAKAGARDLSKGVKQTLDAGRKSAAQAIEGLTDRISEHPLTTVGVAIGVGVLIGFLMRRPRA